MKTIYSMTHLGTRTWTRRSFIAASIAACVSVPILRTVRAGSLSGPNLSPNVKIENFSTNGKSSGITEVPRTTKTDAEWSAQLAAASFEVTRHAGTERPYSGAYEKNHANGLYRCICCDTALFDSTSKFDSGTGWPSFWQPISRLNVAETTDSTLGMRRTAVSCNRCDAHLGHVFDDGPRPTGLRYCMNSVSLHFVARA
jgi:peptide-methionine (R)-S-oxide reductase